MNGAADTEFLRVGVDEIDACSFQPRVNFSMDLVSKLAESIGKGQHDPLIEVEPADAPGRYRIVCGEQRWRAAKAADQHQVTVRLHRRRLGYLERLERQYQENGLRKNFEPLEEASAILLHHELLCIRRAEGLLDRAGIAFNPLASRDISDREEFSEHLRELERLLLEHRVWVTGKGADATLKTLAPWRETEEALRISEAARKAKVSLLRLPDDVREAIRSLPTEQAVQVARVSDPTQQIALAVAAQSLAHDQLRKAVDRLRTNPAATVTEALAAPASTPALTLGFTDQVRQLNDTCRQLSRLVGNLWPRLTPTERHLVAEILAGLSERLEPFDEEAA